MKVDFFKNFATPDSVTKIFTNDVSVDYEDLENIVYDINEKLKSVNVVGIVINTLVRFRDKKRINFSNWGEVTRHKWNEPNQIEQIVITWKFSVLLEGYDQPHNHTLTLKISNSMRPEELFRLIFSQENINDDFEKNFFPVVAQVDFIDRLLADELIEIVNKWNKGLRDSPITVHPILNVLKKNKRKLGYFVEWVTKMVIFITPLLLIMNYIDSLQINGLLDISKDMIKDFVFLFSVMIMSIIISNRVSKLIAEYIFGSLKDYGDSYVFNITRGDKKQHDKMQKQEKNTRKKIFITFALYILSHLASILLGNMLF